MQSLVFLISDEGENEQGCASVAHRLVDNKNPERSKPVKSGKSRCAGFKGGLQSGAIIASLR